LLEAGLKVTKVELPHFPDPLVTHPLNAGKTLVTLDYRKPEGREKLEVMIRKSDVLLESFRPGTLEKMGLTWERLRKLRPKLVYCSISGWKEGARAAHDLNILAATGWLSLSPALPATQVADLAAGEAAARLVLAALLSGKAARLKVSMEGALSQWYPLALTTPRENIWWLGSDPFYRLYEARDGKVAVAALEPRFRSALLARLGISGPEGLAEAIAKTSLADWEDTDFCVNAVRSWETVSRAADGSRTRSKRSPAKAPTRR
jgi:crotonobetainyl-CoA:carnitine CoA-transferase CaiB-like acyl-CoA transferase